LRLEPALTALTVVRLDATVRAPSAHHLAADRWIRAKAPTTACRQLLSKQVPPDPGMVKGEGIRQSAAVASPLQSSLQLRTTRAVCPAPRKLVHRGCCGRELGEGHGLTGCDDRPSALLLPDLFLTFEASAGWEHGQRSKRS